MNRTKILLLLGMLLPELLGCASAAGTQKARMSGTTASIGVATMSADGTIRLQLVAESDDGAVGDAVLEYKPSDAMYTEVKQHIGGIQPGEVKPVPPWPTSPSH